MLSENQPESFLSSVLGRYQLLRRIGHGGMGDVWLAYDPNLKRQVAIKTLPAHAQNDSAYVERFEREAQAIAVLNHPHILSVHDFGRQPLPDGQLLAYIVMPYISSGSLAERLALFAASGALLPEQEALLYLLQAADAIDYAHKHVLIHCDIKPANMLLRDGNWLLLADFGIARILTSDDQDTQKGTGAGTPQYMAPEQARGKAEASSDIYSLAVVAYQLFTGHLPFDGETSYATIIQHITMPPPSPRAYNPSLPLAFEEALLQALAKDPQQRPSSALAFVTTLQQTIRQAPYVPTLLAEVQPPPTLLPIVPTQPTPIEKRPAIARRELLFAGAATILAGGGLATWLLTRSEKITPRPSPSSPVPGSETHPLVLTGHNQPADGLTWSPKDWLLASAGSGSDQQVYLWDIQQLLSSQHLGGTPLYRARQQFPKTTGLFLAWSPDGSALSIGKTSFDSSNLDITREYIQVYQPDLQTFVNGYDRSFAEQGSLLGMTWLKGNYLATLVSIGSLFSDSKPVLHCFLNIWKYGEIHKPLASIPFDTQQTHDGMDVIGPHIVNQSSIIAFPNTQTLEINTSAGLSVGTLTISATTAIWQQQNVLSLSAYQDSSSSSIGSMTGTYNASLAASLPLYTTRDMASNVNGTTENDQLERRIEASQCVEVWNLSTVQKKTILSLSNAPGVIPTLTSVSFSPKPGDTLLAAGADNGSVSLWDTSRSTLPLKVLKGKSAPVCRLSWSADGAWLAASYTDDQASILIWRREEVLRE